MPDITILVTLPVPARRPAFGLALGGASAGVELSRLGPYQRRFSRVGFRIDSEFAAIALPSGAADFGFAAGGAQPGPGFDHVVRGTVDAGNLDRLTEDLRGPGGDNHVFEDPGIDLLLPTCGGDPPVGTAADVQKLLGIGRLRALGMDGRHVAVAIVDDGISLAHLRRRGFSPTLDIYRSWSPATGPRPGGATPGHGTMCAHAALLSAPMASLLDYPVLTSTRIVGGRRFAGLLSDALAAFSRLLTLLGMPDEERAFHSLVVSNSWGLFDPGQDFPAGHPGRYHDNPAHPFNIVTASLAVAGADILFAAGNCGPACPDGRCPAPSSVPPGFRWVNGANSHPDVCSVGAVDINRALVGYSSHGPGALAHDKPDLVAYSHFQGSEVYGAGRADGGTSTACPVAAGVVAALRSVFPFDPAKPQRRPDILRSFLNHNAINPAGGVGWVPDFGHGIIDTGNFASAGSVLT